MTVVVVVISFSIIVSYIFISLLLVTVGIMYSRPGSNISVVNIILFDGENISFEARLVKKWSFKAQWLLYVPPV